MTTNNIQYSEGFTSIPMALAHPKKVETITPLFHR
jgi:hypothetical protein